MTRRGVGAAVLGVAVAAALPAFAASGSASFTVPRGVTKLRVRSWRGNNKTLDTEINVVPGQTFQIDPV